MISLYLTSQNGEMDITQLISTMTWEGNYQSVCRTLQADIILDNFRDRIDPTLGSRLRLLDSGKTLFDGFLFERQKNAESNLISITAYDRGFYLKRNKLIRKYKNKTPKEIVKDIASAFEIDLGEVADPQIKITRNFLGNGGVSAYKIIMTAYTIASQQTGESYAFDFLGDKLRIRVIDISRESVIIEGGSNLMGASNTESVKDMVNRIEIYDNSDNLIKTVGNTEYQKLYGVMQDVIRSSDTEKAVTEAQKRLKDQGYSQKMTVENLGDLRCLTGNTVAVREPNTGICGLFWIQSDIHTWKNGLYLNKLTVSFDRIMDEQEAGSLPSTASSSSNAGEESSDKSGKLKSLGYYNKPRTAVNKTAGSGGEERN